jgi:hypothetical protein
MTTDLRKELRQLVMESYDKGVADAMEAATAAAQAAVAAEREACAKVCEDTTAAWTQPVYNGACMDCAAAIRARGNK